ncbi:MAG: flavodoxin family protein [Candidatus Limisoma sp.]|nr:flavodoxin family protein [Bacteroidales bacterium]MDY5893083.1 flavodoxin family protein [Candidatus Limisoma sp.]
MNILIINASPRKTGNISRMLEVIEQEALNRGAEVNVVEVSKLTIRPCVACMTCRSTGKCVMPEDDAQRVLRMIVACDALVIGAPCYWGNIPGALKLLFDRIVYGMMGENSMAVPVALHKGKKAVIVTSSSTMWPFNIIMNQTRGVVRALKEILGWSGFKILATVQKGGTYRHPEFTDADRNKCRKAARKLKIK